MYRKILFLTLMISVFASSFLMLEREEVSALPCPPGQYSDAKYGFKCVPVDDNKAGVGDNALMEFLGQDINASNTGPTWVQTFSKFLIGLSVVVSYAVEIVSMLMIAYASYLYTTSEGDLKRMRQAKMYVLYAFIGMFIGAFALVIVNMIGGVL